MKPRADAPLVVTAAQYELTLFASYTLLRTGYALVAWKINTLNIILLNPASSVIHIIAWSRKME
jgi:hypothetical protein